MGLPSHSYTGWLLQRWKWVSGSWVNCVMGHMGHESRKITHFISGLLVTASQLAEMFVAFENISSLFVDVGYFPNEAHLPCSAHFCYVSA